MTCGFHLCWVKATASKPADEGSVFPYPKGNLQPPRNLLWRQCRPCGLAAPARLGMGCPCVTVAHSWKTDKLDTPNTNWETQNHFTESTWQSEQRPRGMVPGTRIASHARDEVPPSHKL